MNYATFAEFIAKPTYEDKMALYFCGTANIYTAQSTSRLD